MSSEQALEPLVAAWREQLTTGFRMVPSDLAKKIRAEVRRSRLWFVVGFGFFGAAFALFGALLVSQPDPIRRLAHVVQLVAIAFFIGQFVVHGRRVRAARFDVGRTTIPSLASARVYLETRRAFHRGKWLWARIVALFPGPPIDIYGQIRAGVIGTDAALSSMLVWVALLAVAAFIFQRRAARHYERLLRELDDLECASPVERYLAAHERWK